jgi:hypothetical protein
MASVKGEKEKMWQLITKVSSVCSGRGGVQDETWEKFA